MKTVALAEIVDFYSGGTPSKSTPEFWAGSVPWFSAKDMKQPRLSDSTDHIAEDVFSSTSLRKLPAGTIAMVVRGMILAHTIPISILDVDAAINQDLKALLPKREIDPSFLAAMLRAQHATILSQVSTAAHGTKKLESRVLENLRIPYPALPEQRRIAAILDHADALRTKRLLVLTRLESLIQSIFIEMFADCESESISASTLMPRMRNGLSPATAGGHTAQVLTLSAVTQGEFNPCAVKRGTFAIDPPLDKRVATGDFLICRGNGNKNLVGRGVYSRDERSDLVFPDTVIAGTVDQSIVMMPFLEAAWRQREVRIQIESVARTTNGTYKVNQQTLSSVVVRTPPLALQRVFATRIEQIAEQKALTQRALVVATTLATSLVDRALHGQL